MTLKTAWPLLMLILTDAVGIVGYLLRFSLHGDGELVAATLGAYLALLVFGLQIPLCFWARRYAERLGLQTLSSVYGYHLLFSLVALCLTPFDFDCDEELIRVLSGS